MKNLVNVLMRMIAVFAASGLSVIGAGAIIGTKALDAALIAGILGIATVTEKLARSFLDDGKLSVAETNDAFAAVDKKAKD